MAGLDERRFRQDGLRVLAGSSARAHSQTWAWFPVARLRIGGPLGLSTDRDVPGRIWILVAPLGSFAARLLEARGTWPFGRSASLDLVQWRRHGHRSGDGGLLSATGTAFVARFSRGAQWTMRCAGFG